MKYSNVFAMAQQARSLLGAAVAALEGACTFFDLWNFSKWFSTIFRHSPLFLFLFLFLWMNWISQFFHYKKQGLRRLLLNEKRKENTVDSLALRLHALCPVSVVPFLASHHRPSMLCTPHKSWASLTASYDMTSCSEQCLYKNETTGGVSSNAKVQKSTSQDPNRDLKCPNASFFIQIWRMSASVAANPAYSYSSGSTLANIDSSLQNGDPDRWKRDPQS